MITTSRRRFVQLSAGFAVLGGSAHAQQATGTPPSVVTTPPREWGRHAPPRFILILT
jgi:hypothetical protein